MALLLLLLLLLASLLLLVEHERVEEDHVLQVGQQLEGLRLLHQAPWLILRGYSFSGMGAAT